MIFCLLLFDHQVTWYDRYIVSLTGDYPNIPSVTELSKGPTGFGYDNNSGSPEEAAELRDSVGCYAVKAHGIMNNKKRMKDNTGMAWLDIMTLNQFTNMVTILANLEDQWKRGRGALVACLEG